VQAAVRSLTAVFIVDASGVLWFSHADSVTVDSAVAAHSHRQRHSAAQEVSNFHHDVIH
jgi:hypothetical protein